MKATRSARSRRPLAVLAVAVTLSGCLSGSPAGPQPLGEGTRVLFIGNSLTYVNDVPGILQALADSAGGERLAVASHALPNYALIDHWVDGVAQRQIAAGGWAWVVMQQGWTPAGIYRDTLRLAVRNFGTEIAKIGAKPAMYQTWPPVDRPREFPGSIESYELAAADVGGVVFPVARAWLEVWKSTRPSSCTRIPATVRTRSGATIRIPAALARALQNAAAAVTVAAAARAYPRPG